MKKSVLKGALWAAVLVAGSSLLSARNLQYEVTVTNLTKGQPLSPAVVALHDPNMEPLFMLGAAASEGIWSIAEDADTGPLVAALSGDPLLYDLEISGGPIPPGQSVTVVLNGGPGQGRRSLSLAGMLVTTNDAFYAINGQELPFPIYFFRSPWTGVFMAPAYDSGTEVNSESCDKIPGPPCGNPMVRDTEGAEGYVYVHSGIHGIGDLEASAADWNNPVAKITVRISRTGF